MVCKATNYGAPDSHPPEVISQDEDNRFVTDEQIEHWNAGTAGQAQYMSLVFQRAALVPDIPTGGEFQYPIPDGGLWTNTPLPGSDALYITTRLFTTDGESPQQSVWSPPRLFVQHGPEGATGPQGIPGTNGIQGNPGADGTDGSNGVNGDDGTSIIWLGDAASHPIGAVDGNAYYNTTDKKSYVYWDDAWYQMTIDGFDGQNGIGIVWKGDSSTPPANPEINWAYRDTDNGLVYIYDGVAWELMIQDGNDGPAGANGEDGLSIYITYHDAHPLTSPPPPPPDNIDGTNNGWHTAITSDVAWMSQKVGDGTGTGWGLAIPIKGYRGSGTFSIDESDAGTTYIGPADAAAFAGTLTEAAAKNVARDIIDTFSSDGFIHTNDKVTITDNNNQIAGTRVFIGLTTNNIGDVLLSSFSGLITETIDGGLLVNGTVSAVSMAADVISGGIINATLLNGAVIEGGIFKTNSDPATNGGVIITGDTLYVYDASGNIRVKLGDLS